MNPFKLGVEEICKEKWKPWFQKGGWIVQDFTSPESANFQIPRVLEKLKPSTDDEGLKIIEKKLRTYAKSLNFPHDGEASRGRFMFCFDYKFKPNTKHGIWIKKDDYDKYWSWQKPWFYLLIWCDDRQKRYIHQIRDPAAYNYRWVQGSDGGGFYYLIPDADYWEAIEANVPTAFTQPLSEVDSIALIFAENRWKEGGSVGNIVITADDKKRGRELLSKPNPSPLVLRETANALKRILE